MKLTASIENGVLTLALSGELDEHGAGELRRMADLTIDEYAVAEKAVFDLGRVSFMDSTGICFLTVILT